MCLDRSHHSYGTMAAESGAALSSAAAAAAANAAKPTNSIMDEILAASATAAVGEEEPLCHSHLQMLSLTTYRYLCRFCQLYGTQVLVLAVLVALAAYRREMSCNRVFHDMEGAAERRGSAAVDGWTSKAEDNEDEDDSDDNNEEDVGDGNDESRRDGREENPAKSKASTKRRPNDGEDEIDDLLDGAALLSRPLVAIWDVAADTAKEGMELVSSSGSSASASSPDSASAAVTSAKIDAPNQQSSGRTKTGTLVAATKPPAPQTSPLLHLSPDTTVHILIYLHPRDITTGFACAAKATRSLVDDELSTGLVVASKDYPNALPRRSSSHSVSVMLWKQLWWRDYGHTLSRWDIGRKAMKRSVGARLGGNNDDDEVNNNSSANRSPKPIENPAFRHLESSLTEAKICEDTNIDNGTAAANTFLSSQSRSTMKNLYFSFAACWVDYTLAGQNTLERCLVGLHGHVFDISDFVESHPGSPETLLVQAGRDATAFFEDLGHSMGARRIALSMCAVMDRSCAEQRPMSNIAARSLPAAPAPRGSSCGLCLPAGGSGAVPERSDVAASRALAAKAAGSMPMGRSKPRRAGCLQRIREDLHKGKVKAQVCADKWAASVGNGTALEGGMLGSVRVYWDPLRGEWLAWYTDMNFQPVYLGSDVTSYGAK